LDKASLDAVYLALERDAVLLSEDGGLRLVVPSVGLTNSIGVQPLLMFAREHKVIAHAEYVNVVMGKLARNHDFLSIRTEDLVAVVRRDATRVAAGVVAALETFRGPTLELGSGVQVCCEFLASVVPLCPPPVVKSYLKLALDVLQHGRATHAEAIHRALAEAIKHGMESIAKKHATPLKRHLGTLLNPPDVRPQRIQRTPVSLAVKEFMLRIERVDERTR
jgi:hypothetical protein